MIIGLYFNIGYKFNYFSAKQEKKSYFFCHLIGQIHKIGDRQLLGPLRHHFISEEIGGRHVVLAKQWFERHAQHLTALIEHRLDDPLEQSLITAKIRDLITRHTNDGTLDLRGRIEHILINREKILRIVPRLYHHTEDAILLRAWLRSDAQGDLPLDHSRAARDEIFVVKHLEEDLRGDIVGIVAREHKRLTIKYFREIHAQKILSEDIVAQLRKLLVEVSHALGVDLHSFHLPRLFHEILRQHAHSRSYLEHGNIGTRVYRISNALGDIEIRKEMLAKVLLRSNLFHVVRWQGKACAVRPC